VSIDGAPVLGDPTASVVLIQYSEFECPFCGRFANEILPELKARYLDTGKVFLVFKHFPLAMHKNAMPAAIAADCAAQQDRFWQLHDLMFRNQPDLSASRIDGLARELELDQERLAQCIASGSKRVQADLASGKALQLSSTPMFFAGTRLADGRVRVSQIIQGARPPDEFTRVLDGLIK
jgi:protein-disulfide isomerase